MTISTSKAQPMSNQTFAPAPPLSVNAEAVARLKPQLATFIASSSPIALNLNLAEVAQAAAEEIIDGRFSLEQVRRLAASLPQATGEQRVRLIGLATTLRGTAFCYLQALHTTQQWPVRKFFEQAAEGAINFIDALVAGFGIADLFQSTPNGAPSAFKAQKLFTLASNFGIFSVLFSTLMGATTALYIGGGIFVSIVLLSLVWAIFRPIPPNLPAGVERWSNREHLAAAPPANPALLREVAEKISQGRHVLIKGPSQTGKTAFLDALTAAIEQGAYPALTGFTVLKANGAVISRYKPHSGESASALSEVGGSLHTASRSILIIEGLGALYSRQVARELAIRLDANSGFCKVIGVVTDEEFQKSVETDPIMLSRFHVILKEPPTSLEVMQTLSRRVLYDSQRPLIEPGTLDQMVNSRTPFEATQLLERCLQATAPTQMTDLARKIEVLRAELVSRQAAAATHAFQLDNPEIERLLNALREAETARSEERAHINRLFALKGMSDQLKIELCQTVLSILDNTQTSSPGRLAFFQSLSHRFEALLKREAAKAKINLIIDQPLVAQLAKNS